MSEIRFVLDKSSPVPLQTQIAEQVRIWLLMGRLREGDLLPSIRDTERDLDVGRSIIWAAYKELQEDGLIISHERSRARISKRPPADVGEVQKKLAICEKLALQLLRSLNVSSIAPGSFVRYFSNRIREVDAEHCPVGAVDDSLVLAQDFAREIEQAVGMKTVPIRYSDLQTDPQLVKKVRYLVTTYWFAGLTKIAKPLGVPVFYVSAEWSKAMLDEIAKLPSSSRILLVFHKRDLQHSGISFHNDLKRIFGNSGKRFEAISIRSHEQLEAIAGSRKYKLIFVGNPVWDTLPEPIRRLPQLRRPIITLNISELESLRTHLGQIF